MPVIYVGRENDQEDAHFIGFDTERAVRMAVHHLHGLGHRRIALHNAPQELLESRHREIGYRIALDQCSIPYDPELVCTADLGYDIKLQQAATKHNVERLLALPDPPTAMIAVSIFRAIPIYETAIHLGLRVPDDLSLIGIFGTPVTDYFQSRVTAFLFSYEELGDVAIQMLMNASVTTVPYQRIYLQPKMVSGETTSVLGD